MRRLLILVLSLLPLATFAIGVESSVTLLDRLESALAHSEEFASMRLARVQSMRQIQDSPHTSFEQIYDLNIAIAEEFETYQFDSTVNYLYWNLGVGRMLGDQYKIDKALIALGCAHAKAGYRFEASQFLTVQLDTTRLDPSLLADYYMAQYHMYTTTESPTNSVNTISEQANYYRDRLFELLPIDSFEYRILRVQQFLERGELDKAERILLLMLDEYPADSYELAVVSSNVAKLYEHRGNTEKQLHYAIKSALCEVRAGVRDDTSLNSLAILLFNEGDVSQAFRMSRAALDFALAYNAKTRVWQVASMLPTIESAYRGQQQRQNNHIYIFLTVALVMAMMLIVIHLVQRIQRDKLDQAQRQLQEANRNLVENNESLQAANRQLSQLNGDIAEANTVKEEYIALFLRVYSECIDKMEGLQRRVRKLATHDNLKELKRELAKSDLVDEELVHFYEMFDNAFLRLYPNFVSEFNSLLEEEARIELKKDEKLNTELRIFALIRLGISDSSKIAALLRYSVNTIYNYRAKVKNRACVSREEFEERIKKIGSFRSDE